MRADEIREMSSQDIARLNTVLREQQLKGTVTAATPTMDAAAKSAAKTTTPKRAAKKSAAKKTSRAAR
jgi:hypothetical protein